MTVRFAAAQRRRESVSRTAQRLSARVTRFVRQAQLTWLLILLSLSVLSVFLTAQFREAWPLSVYLIPLLLAMDVLSFSRLVLLECVVAVCLAVSLSLLHITALRLIGVVVVVGGTAIVTAHTWSRTRHGIVQVRGDSMLVDLRDRLASQSQLPVLPREWHAEAVMKSADGASFAGDFIAAAKTRGGRMLEVVVVDVSGKGLEAGTRSLQLSGAFGGLLGSLPTDAFLPAANEYLLRQEWREGFATAIHLAVNLESGAFEVRTAGHPPAVQFHAGSGRWEAHWTEGPVLGVVGAAEYSVHRGRLDVGDALLLYTDGLVESPKRDIAYGIDKLLGEAERLVPLGFSGGAERLVASVKSQTDDRALLLLYRA